MDQEARSRIKRDADLFRALASEPRLMIVERLARGECCVCDLAEIVGSDQSTISRHLSILKSNGVVEGERRGNHIYYRLLTPCVLSVLSCATRAVDECDGTAAPRISTPEKEGQ